MKIVMIAIACAALAACDKNPTDTTTTTAATGTAVDNTKVNDRDKDALTLTPLDQKNNAADTQITAQVRKMLMADDTLSTDAKNVKVITQDANVVLRGPVKTDAEKAAVGTRAGLVTGVKHVENDLDVIK